jgi:hypothetical protein
VAWGAQVIEAQNLITLVQYAITGAEGGGYSVMGNCRSMSWCGKLCANPEKWGNKLCGGCQIFAREKR